MLLQTILGALAGLSFLLLLWQWLAARRFPLHQRSADLEIGSGNARKRSGPNGSSALPAVTLLKPLKGCDEFTEKCLRSWFTQDYAGEIQILFAVADANDAAVAVAKKLIAEFPERDAQLVVCPERVGANAKVSKLVQLESLAKHEIIIISDADVLVPADLLTNLTQPLRDEKVGLVNCFYQLANPTTLAMRWEAIAINADFWSQVLQSKSLKPLDFALGAVMATRRERLAEIGGFRALADCLADDYQLGHRIAKRGHRIELCPVVVECWSPPMNWGDVWRHQLRWARTIRVCQPLPYFVSILSNATLWPLLWLAAQPSLSCRLCVICFLILRIAAVAKFQLRLAGSHRIFAYLWLVPFKDAFQALIWFGAFIGNQIEWRGERYHLRRDGSLLRI